MATHRALILKSTTSPLSLESVLTPSALPGTVVVRILGTYILPYLQSVLTGKLPYTLTLPLTPGASCVARVQEAPPDAVTLQAGQLVLCDTTVRARDDPDQAILMGLHGGMTEQTRKLMEGVWRDGSFAECAKFPLENVFKLDEDLLFGQLGYSVEDLCSLPAFLVPFGGLSEIDIKPGDTVIVAPATGRFGGGAVTTVLAMGARVVACGRNKGTLDQMKKIFDYTGRFEIVSLEGDAQRDAQQMITKSGNGGNGADAYIDFSPAAAAGSSHMTSALMALKSKGKAAFMGGIFGKIEIDHGTLIMKSLRIQGRFMYDRDMIIRLIKMIENGNLKLGEKWTGVRTVGKFGLEQADEALALAEKEVGWGKQVLLMP